MANGNVITTHGLTKRYGASITAVDALDLEVHRGEVFGFLGPNGAGKTTTLRMLLGLIRPTAGSAVVAEHRPGDPKGLRRIGSLVESPAFYPYLSGRENLKIMSDYAGLPHQRVDAALEEVDLADRAKDRFGTYSMGMKQRLGVAAALMKDPELMILDEPTNGLDPRGRRRDARPNPAAGHWRSHRDTFQPPAQRGRADMRSRGHHQPGQARPPGHGS